MMNGSAVSDTYVQNDGSSRIAARAARIGAQSGHAASARTGARHIIVTMTMKLARSRAGTPAG